MRPRHLPTPLYPCSLCCDATVPENLTWWAGGPKSGPDWYCQQCLARIKNGERSLGLGPNDWNKRMGTNLRSELHRQNAQACQ